MEIKVISKEEVLPLHNALEKALGISVYNYCNKASPCPVRWREKSGKYAEMHHIHFAGTDKEQCCLCGTQFGKNGLLVKFQQLLTNRLLELELGI